ncbi:transcriptional repressor, partial [Escherichia coli]
MSDTRARATGDGGPRRTTRQREAVRAALDASDEFVSAQSLHQSLRTEGSTIGLATVYRALAALAEDGEADALQPGGEVLYRACTRTHHHHLI